MKQFKLSGITGYIHQDRGLVCFGGMTINLIDALKMKSTLGNAVRRSMGV